MLGDEVPPMPFSLRQKVSTFTCERMEVYRHTLFIFSSRWEEGRQLKSFRCDAICDQKRPNSTIDWPLTVCSNLDIDTIILASQSQATPIFKACVLRNM